MVRFIGSVSPLGKAQRPRKLSLRASERADRGDPLDQLQRAPLLGRRVDALRQYELDLPVLEPQHQAELPLPSSRSDLLGKGG